MNDADILQHISALRDALRYEINGLAAQIRLLSDKVELVETHGHARETNIAEIRADLAALTHKVNNP